MIEILLDMVLEIAYDNSPKVRKVVDFIKNEGESGKEKAEREFERGYKKASMLSAEELDQEVRERHSLGKDDPYSLGMYQYYKKLRK